MRVLMLVIRYDVDDWATNFIPLWCEKLADHVERLDVLALHRGAVGDVPPNMHVYSMGKEDGRGRAGLLAGFYKHAARLIPACDAVFVHMIPRYALLAAPLALPLRKPMTLWYTHREPSADLRRSLPLVKNVVTAVKSSFPLQTDKLQALGHGIDTGAFMPPDEPPADEARYVVQVARVQPIKRQHVLLAALEQLPEDVQAVIVGGVSEGVDQTYYERLWADAPPGRVTFTGGLPAADVRAWYGRAAVAVNLSPVGLFDKAALESMATGTPTIVTNAAFADLLGAWRDLLLIDGDLTPERLAERIAAVLALPDDQRAAMGDTLRENVVAAHSLDALMPRLVRVLGR